MAIPGELLPYGGSFSPDARYCWLKQSDALVVDRLMRTPRKAEDPAVAMQI